MPQDYSFLSNYIANLVTPSQNPDESPLQDDSDLYDVRDEDDIPADQDSGGYGIDSDDEQSDDDQQYQNDDTPYEYNEDGYSGGGGGGNSAAPEAPGGLGRSISNIESGGKYTATNKHSSAVGKYQFLWSAWGDSIKKQTGVKSKEEFLHSPKAQEEYYSYYEKSYLMPQVAKLKQFNKAGLSDDQLAKLVHFRGAAGAKRYLQGKASDKPEAYNMSTSKYISSKRLGGGVAGSPEQQHMGLNNEHFDSMYFPMHGENEFRGLDDGSPVLLEDETGKKKVLKGKYHRTTMSGKVFEKRLK